MLRVDTMTVFKDLIDIGFLFKCLTIVFLVSCAFGGIEAGIESIFVSFAVVGMFIVMSLLSD